MNPQQVLALRRQIEDAVQALVEEALKVGLEEEYDMGITVTAQVGDTIRVRDVGFGRPPLGKIVKVYANGDLKVLLLSGSRKDEVVKVRFVEDGVGRLVGGSAKRAA